ncbi:hypothetical protein KXS11_10455 [Plantibacter flavus]|uniref:hypothetical protein n=1 Tax=Plantibacter flavus TaxID=150123 RepID=UPI003F1677D7
MMKKLTGSTLCRVGLASALTVALAATAVGPATAVPNVQPTSVVAMAESNASDSDAETRVAWLAIVTAVIAAGGAADYMGQQAAVKMYHAGLRSAEYQQIKWPMRVAVANLLTPVFGGIFMVAFENKFNSL